MFTKWYLPKIIAKKKQTRLKIQFHKIFKKFLNNLKNKNNIFVHRDFHVSNLIYENNNIGVLDSQDALYGNPAYDLASLIDDVRIKTSLKEKEKIYEEFVRVNKHINQAQFKNDFEILSILRNFKIIGIFTRLSQRDKKKQYLKLIPYAWNLIEMRIYKNPKFLELKNLIDLNFPKQKKNYKNMKIKHAFILCAGFGKRLNPITLEIPKPLIEINKITLLENTIRLLEKLEIQTIKINTFYLGEQIKEFLKNLIQKLNIEIIEDGDQILDTGRYLQSKQVY